MHMDGMVFKNNRLFLSVMSLKSVYSDSYHQKVIKKKDLPLVHSCPLRPVGVRNFIELAATHQPAMGKGQHLFFCPTRTKAGQKIE